MSQQTHTAPTPAAPPEATRTERLLVLLLAGGVFISVMNTTMVNVALPTIRDTFSVNAAGAGWLATLYSLFFGIATPFYGRLGDRYGLRRMYVLGMTIFAVSSVCASLVPTSQFWLLILFRVGQGLGSAAVPPLGTAMIMRAVPSVRRGAAIGMVAASVGAGQAFGPPLGGALTDFVSWRAVFLISALVIVLIPFQYRMFPSEIDPDRKPVDWFGGLALALTLGGTLIAVGNIEEQGLASPAVLGSLAVAAVALIVTILRQRNVHFPFIDPVLIGNTRFVLYCVTAFTMMSAGVSMLIIAPFLLEDVNGLSTSSTGLVLLAQAGMVTLLSRPVGKLADRYDALLLSTIGLTTVFGVFVVFATVAVGWPVWALVPLFLVFGAGQASTFAPLQTTVTRIVPSRLAGTGIGLYNMLFFVGSAFGAAISTALISARDGKDALLPFYLGPSEHSNFGDAYLWGLTAAAAGIILLQIARRQPVDAGEAAEGR